MDEAGPLRELVAVFQHTPQIPLPAFARPCLDEYIVQLFLLAIAKATKRSNASSSTTADSNVLKWRPLDSHHNPHIGMLKFNSVLPLSQLRRCPELIEFEEQQSVQVYIQTAHTFNTPKRLAVFDMDSTLIQQEVIDMLAAHVGVEAEVSDITSRAMNGELDFEASLRARVALLKGLRANVFEDLKTQITFSPGAITLLRCLKKMGVKTALISGGFVPLARYVGDKLGIDYIYANELAVDTATGTLTGELSPSHIPVVPLRKKTLLEFHATELGITDPAEIMAVGDGANDLPMMWAAGLGVAVNAKPKVQREAPGRLNGPAALEDLLFLLGKNAEDIERLAS